MSSPALQIETPREPKPRRLKKRIGRARRLEKRVEPKSDGRYLIYYKPS